MTTDPDQYNLEYINNTIVIPLSGLDDGKIFYSTQEADIGEYASIAVDGDFVNAFGVLANDEDIFAFGIQGDMPTSSPGGEITYSGSYSKIIFEDDSYQHISQDVDLNVDFNSGTISGSAANDSNENFASFYGEIDDNGASLSITDQDGYYLADGSFFGENSEAFAAGFSQENAVGIVDTQY